MRVAFFENRAQAEPTRQCLVQAGISAETHNESGLAQLWFVPRRRTGVRLEVSAGRAKPIGAQTGGGFKVPNCKKCPATPSATRFHILRRRILNISILLSGIWLLPGSHGNLIQSDATAASGNTKMPEFVGNSDAKAPTYLRDVLPILMGKCARCHNDQSRFLQNWLDYRTASAKRWEIKRRVWDSWKGAYFKQPMPTGNSPESEAITEEERTTIRNWVESGAICGVRPAFNSAQSKTERIELGKHLFTTICAACHQPTGQGLPGRFPPLAGSDFLNSDKHRAIKIVVNGLQGEVTVNGQRFNNSMPKFPLTDDDIANALTYVYNSFGNSGKEVTPEEVNAARAEKDKLNLTGHNQTAKVPDEKSPFE
jgi:mono/diheme cytochrome c family protein